MAPTGSWTTWLLTTWRRCGRRIEDAGPAPAMPLDFEGLTYTRPTTQRIVEWFEPR